MNTTEQRLEDMREIWRSQLKRVEDTLAAHLHRLELHVRANAAAIRAIDAEHESIADRLSKQEAKQQHPEDLEPEAGHLPEPLKANPPKTKVYHLRPAP